MSDTLARVIEREPDWARCRRRCRPRCRTSSGAVCRKDPRQRVQATSATSRLALEGAFDTAVPQPGRASRRSRSGARVALVGSRRHRERRDLGTLVWAAMRPATVARRVSRLQVTPSGTAALSIGWNNRDLAITPDGSRVVYVGNRGTQLFVRALDALAPVAVFTGPPRGPFCSPDGQWIGFVDGLGD